MAPKFNKHHVSRSPHPSYSPDLRPCGFWLSGTGILKEVLKDREFNSSDEIEEAITITNVWNELTFNEWQSVFNNWVSRLAWVIKNEKEYIIA
jgi:hypothetical protein